MKAVNKFFNKENTHKIFLCKVDFSSIPKKLQCYYNIDDCTVSAFSWDDARDVVDYLNNVVEVISEVEFEDDFNHSVDRDVLSDEDEKYLESKEVSACLYKYEYNEELQRLIDILDADFVYGDKDSNFGLLYAYDTYDDFDCYGDGFTGYVKIIAKAVIQD